MKKKGVGRLFRGKKAMSLVSFPVVREPLRVLHSKRYVLFARVFIGEYWATRR